MPAEMPGEFQKCDILFTNVVQDADRSVLATRQSENASPGSSEFPLKRLYTLHWLLEMLFEEMFERFHESVPKITLVRNRFRNRCLRALPSLCPNFQTACACASLKRVSRILLR